MDTTQPPLTCAECGEPILTTDHIASRWPEDRETGRRIGEMIPYHDECAPALEQ